MTKPALQATGLTKHFRRPGGETVTAVDGVDLSAAIGKTGATTRAEAARLAQANGWL